MQIHPQAHHCHICNSIKHGNGLCQVKHIYIHTHPHTNHLNENLNLNHKHHLRKLPEKISNRTSPEQIIKIKQTLLCYCQPIKPGSNGTSSPTRLGGRRILGNLQISACMTYQSKEIENSSIMLVYAIKNPVKIFKGYPNSSGYSENYLSSFSPLQFLLFLHLKERKYIYSTCSIFITKIKKVVLPFISSNGPFS